MLKIQVITPVYIGSGKKICAIKKGQFIYSVDEIIKEKIDNTKNNDLLKMKKSCWYLARSNNPSKEDYFRAFNIDERLISNSSIVSNDPLYAKNVSSNYEDLFLFQKSLGKMIIPGSTIKGIINNIFWYYIINKRKEIKEYFINNISSTNKILDELDGSIRNIKYFLKISDIVLDCGAKVVTIKNYGLKKGNRKIGNHETIFCNESIQTSAIGEIPEFEIKMLKEVKKEIEKKRTY